MYTCGASLETSLKLKKNQMARPSSITLARNEILAEFSKASQKIYSQAQLANVLLHNRSSWHLAKGTTLLDFISFLTRHGNLKAHKFRSKTYGREIIRYSWHATSPLELALSLKPRAYLCHGTAAMLHGLIKQGAKTIYVNAEQSVKPSNNSLPTQDGINRAFFGKQRQSNLIYTYNGLSFVMISGKNTNRLGVEESPGIASEALQVTNVERTLIDIVVRPAYAGGISQVYKAYRTAKDRVSVDRLLTTLKRLDYTYPYHQSIGFLMQKTGYPVKSYAKLHALGLENDFYLTHALREPEYSQEWRMFYPKELK